MGLWVLTIFAYYKYDNIQQTYEYRFTTGSKIFMRCIQGGRYDLNGKWIQECIGQSRTDITLKHQIMVF